MQSKYLFSENKSIKIFISKSQNSNEENIELSCTFQDGKRIS